MEPRFVSRTSRPPEPGVVMQRQIELIGAAWGLGGADPGCAQAPALLAPLLEERLRGCGAQPLPGPMLSTFPNERRKQLAVSRLCGLLAAAVAESVRNAVATVAVAEAGAVGLGALVVAAASTVAVDVTGILAASLLAGLGLFVLPNKRRQAKRDFHAKAEELEQRLIEVMGEQFEHELARSMDRVREAISP